MANDAVNQTIREAFGMESDSDKQDKRDADEVLKMFRAYKDAKRKKEYEWFVNDNFYNNNHYLRYNPSLQQLQPVPLKELADKVTVNFVGQVVRGITSFLNKEHPVVTVLPGLQSDEAYEKAKKEKHLIDYWYDHLSLNRKIKEVTMDACKYGIGWFKVAWDNTALSPTPPYTLQNGDEYHNTYGDIMVDRVDPFDVYPDPIAGIDNMRGIIHAFTRTIGEIKSNKRFRNTEKVAPDGKVSASAIKTQAMQSQQSSQQNIGAGPEEHKTVVILEAYVRKYDEDNGWHIRQVTTTETGILLSNEKWPFDSFPFVPYLTDISATLLGSTGVIRNIREINRAFNQQTSQVLKTSRIMGHINWRAPRGANLNIITDVDGQVIEFDPTPGGAPEQTQPVNLPSYIMENLANYERYIKDISGLHDASMGKSPFSRASGELVNRLQEGDSQNLAMYRDNLDDSLIRLFKLALCTAKENYSSKRKFRVNENDGMAQYHWIEITGKDISMEDDIKVNSGTAMPYSLADKQDTALNLWKEGIVKDPDAILKLMNMPDVDNALGNDQLDIERQLQENRDMMAGKNPGKPVIAENHGVHIKVIDNFVKNPVWKTLTPKVQQLILSHRGDHIDFSVQLAQITASMQFEPIKRNESLMVRANSLGEFTPIEATQYLAKSGIQSDRAEIQQRGGLVVQDPEQARQQAMLEDNEMLVDPNDPSELSRPMHISPGDNHAVHLQVHGEATMQPGFKFQPPHVQQYFKNHMLQHQQAYAAQTNAAGLVPDETSSLPNRPGLGKPVDKTPTPVPRTPVTSLPTAFHHSQMAELQKQADAGEKLKAQQLSAKTQKKSTQSKK